MQDAIQHRDIKVYYQPIISLKTGKVVGAEALARWPQADGSYLSPEIFVALAQETGLSEPLTRLIIESVFDDLGKWLRQYPHQHISINLESADLTSETLPALLSQKVNHWQLKPAQIALELTEREFADPKNSAPFIAKYRQAGHSIYIDDFGTGYSSLSYLQDLDVDILKIDKSFVDALEYNNVTPHIIEIAKTLKLEMVAEGIETENQEAGYASTACSTVRAGFTVKRCRKQNLFCGQKNGFSMAVDGEMAGGTPHSQSHHSSIMGANPP